MQVRELAAKKYEYLAAPVHFKAGTKIRLKITATDQDHGFKVAPFPDGAQPTGARFCFVPRLLAPQKRRNNHDRLYRSDAGQHKCLKCCHTCGLGHRGMQSQMVVDHYTSE